MEILKEEIVSISATSSHSSSNLNSNGDRRNIFSLKNEHFELEKLPKDILFEILKFLHFLDLLKLGTVNKYFNSICNSEILWKNVCQNELKLDFFSWKDFARWLYFPKYDVCGARQCSSLLEDGVCKVFGISRTNCSFKSPSKVSCPERLLRVSSKNHHIMVLSVTGNIYVWGSNDSGQINPSNSLSLSFVNPFRIPVEKIVAISAGDFHCLALNNEGKVFAWGSNSGSQVLPGGSSRISSPVLVPLEEKASKISAGSRHSLALSESGQVFSWGSNRHGVTGRGFTPSSDVSKIPTFSHTQVTHIYSGGRFSMAKTIFNEIYSWGINNNGVLCLPEFKQYYFPEKSEILSSYQIVDISCGYAHGLALLTSGEVITWGGGHLINNGGLKNQPGRVNLPDPAIRIGTGRFHSWCLLKNNVWYRWGRNSELQLGDSPLNQIPSPLASSFLNISDQ